MKHLKIITLLIAVFTTLSGCEAKITNAKTETYKVWGNCGMCQETIEKAVKQKNIAKGKWNKDTKMIIISYDSIKTNSDAILKRIALTGYDNDKFIAPDEAYNKRPECCHYERKSLPISQSETKVELNENPKTEIINTPAVVETKTENQLKIIFEKYYEIKNALVKSDSKTASAKANDLIASINSIKMEDLTTEEHTVWMKIKSSLANDAGLIKTNKDIAKQRIVFTTLSKNMYALIKVSKQQTTTYYQHCPMYNNGKGADWLSKEKEIKNPYYGSQMLNCGSLEETIK
jgi:copper chaperone CopZ